MKNSNKIKNIQALEILDSRGNPTLMAEVILENGVSAKACASSGASIGMYEALELRDGEMQRFFGKGVLKACENVKTRIVQVLKGKKVTEQKEIDTAMMELDGTENKSNLGANAMVAVSFACVKAAAKFKEFPLYKYLTEISGLNVKKFLMPIPMLNVINGGKHSDSGLDIQEFMIVPQAFRFSEKIRQAAEIYHTLKEIIGKSGYSQGVGDEGGFAPKLETNFQALEFLKKAVERAGYKLGKDANFTLDCAASEFYDKEEKKYILRRPQTSLTSDQLLALYNEWKEKFPIVSFEDPFSEIDWAGWKKMTQRNGNNLMLVGDDLFATNLKLLEQGIREKVANAVLVKPNQIGTLTETLNCIKLAKESGYKIIISHRSGETCDSFISDLAVGVGADFVKFGAPARGERVAKYNRLLEIESELRNKNK